MSTTRYLGSRARMASIDGENELEAGIPLQGGPFASTSSRGSLHTSSNHGNSSIIRLRRRAQDIEEEDEAEEYSGDTVKLTVYRIMTMVILLAFGSAKAWESLENRAFSATWTDWVGGTIIGALWYYIGLYESLKPPVARWFFHVDHSLEVFYTPLLAIGILYIAILLRVWLLITVPTISRIIVTVTRSDMPPWLWQFAAIPSIFMGYGLSLMAAAFALGLIYGSLYLICQLLLILALVISPQYVGVLINGISQWIRRTYAGYLERKDDYPLVYGFLTVVLFVACLYPSHYVLFSFLSWIPICKDLSQPF